MGTKGMPITPRDIRNNEFAVGMRGYDRDEVHSFLAKVANDYERVLDAVSSARSTQREPGHDDFGVLAAARAGADDIIQQGAAEAEHVRQQAADEAERVRRDAAEEATSIRQRAREKAARLLAEAEAEQEIAEEPPPAPGEVAQMLADAAREAATLLEEAYDQAAEQLQKAERRALEITEEAEKQCREALEEGRERLSSLQAHDRDLTVAMAEMEGLVAELQKHTISLLRGPASAESAPVPSE
jgi:DivIVA domain-containing protein